MKAFGDQSSDQRKTRMFGPVIGMTFAGLAFLVLASLFLADSFDETSQHREQTMLAQGFDRQASELAAVIVPQVVWDEAVARLDHRVDPAWADENIGSYLYTFNGFTRSFVVNSAGQVIYASVDGRRSGAGAYAPFAAQLGPLTAPLRLAEAARPPLRAGTGHAQIIAPPLQRTGVVMEGGQAMLVVLTLVQPDFGKTMLRSAQAPLVVNAIPIDHKMLQAFGERYLIEDLRLVGPGMKRVRSATVQLKDPAGRHVASLAWEPRHPGADLLLRLSLPMAAAFLLFAYLSVKVVQRGSAIAGELIASEARAKHLAYHDSLTQLPNRAMLFERLRAALAQSRREGGQTAVHCLDLDRFKDVNDTLGHDAGDQLIREVAKRLGQLCGESDLIARLGGDEFVVVQNPASRDSAEALAGAIFAALREPFQIEYGTVEIGVSIGIAMVDRADAEPTEVLRWADLALYRSKEAGRMRATFFEPEMDTALRLRRTLEADLRKALADRTLAMVYQPQIDASGRTTGVEALVRWWHPSRGNIPPGIFVPLAEESGLILGLGEFVMRRVFIESAEWWGLRTAINMSAVQLRSPQLIDMVRRLVRECRVEPCHYEIELTETALLGEDDVTADNIQALKAMGFTIALDDFGTGFSSLAVLQRFSVDKLKIDRSFVSNLGRGGEPEALVDAIIQLARALDLRVVAEGVETQEQLELLLAAGCSEFQGHLMGYPVLADELEPLIDAPPTPLRRYGGKRG